MNSKPWVVYAFTILLAFCSLFYELVYAQILSVCLGGTKNQYFLVIAIFTCALGFGSIAFSRVKLKYNLRKTFFLVELLLTLLGSIGPFFITWILQPSDLEALAFFKIVTSYALIFCIGFLSGFEIPCLFSMLDKSQGKVLAFDYLGMLLASVLFPFFFLPELGTASSTLLIASFNILALIWLRSESPNPKITIFLTLLCFLLMMFIVSARVELNLLLSRLYMGQA